MKKLLLALLLIPSIVYADSVTSGSVGLLKPTTGVYSSRSWADKINSNFDIIAATLTTLITTPGGINENSTPTWRGSHTFTSSTTFLNTSSFSATIFASSNVVIQSTMNYPIPLQVGPGGIAPLSSLVTAVFQDVRNTLGVSRIAVKNVLDGTELILGATSKAGQVGTFNNFPLGIRANDTVVIFVSTGYNSTSDPFVTINDRLYVTGSQSFPIDRGPTSLIDVNGGSITVRGANSGLRVSGLASQDCVGTDAHGTFGAGTCGGGSSGNSTSTVRLKYPGFVMISTQSICRVSCMSVGHSTLNVVSISAYLAKGSTAASTWVQIVESTGGVNALPFKTYGSRFPPIVITTATSDNYSSYSSITTTGIVVNSGSWLGVAITSTSLIGGNAPEGLEVHINRWEKPYGSTD